MPHQIRNKYKYKMHDYDDSYGNFADNSRWQQVKLSDIIEW